MRHAKSQEAQRHNGEKYFFQLKAAKMSWNIKDFKNNSTTYSFVALQEKQQYDIILKHNR
jgi:hypothetical protein